MDELMKDAETTPPLIPLQNATLSGLPAEIAVPTYDRSQLTAGIVHIGVGNFHRAHQAWYLHRLMQKGLAHDWAIIGAGVRSGDADMRDRLLAQDCLTTLVELDPNSVSAEVIGSMIDFLPVEEDNASLIRAMSNPTIRIVSLTVTEGGYFLDASGELDTTHADIQHDAAHPDRPRTAFGAIVAALRTRRDQSLVPFSCQCCDNLQNNGAVMRQTVVGLARLSDPALADWIDTNCTFPDSMVDCIVPATGSSELSLVRDMGIDDQAPVTHENFRQWVVEDAFCNGRPPWEKVGATLIDDVHPYESMKIRILNAGHQVLANAGELLGLETIADCMADSDLLAFFRAVQTHEVLPQVDPVPGMSTMDYLAIIEERFANPKIKDTTRRVAFDGSCRHTGFILPIISERIDKNANVNGLALVEALWCRMCVGTREDNSTIEPNDPSWADLTRLAQAASTKPEVWLKNSKLYGEIANTPSFVGSFSEALENLRDLGVRATLANYSKP